MTIREALAFVTSEISRIESANPGKELRPWERDACPAAKQHWGRVQQRIALERILKKSHGRDPGSRSAWCLEEFHFGVPNHRPGPKRRAATFARQKTTTVDSDLPWESDL